MLKGKRVLSGLSDCLSAGWFSIDFLATVEQSVEEMNKAVLAHELFNCYLSKVGIKDRATSFN